MHFDGSYFGTEESGEHGLLVIPSPSIVPDIASRIGPSLVGPVVIPRTLSAPKIVVFDSGLGGLTVYRELVKARPDAHFVYAADDALFPYGKVEAAHLITRVTGLIGGLIETHRPDLVVIACNTASTLVLPTLRARFSVLFIGTVPAIKPACAASASKLVSVLGTEATVKREYTRALIREFAAGCAVTLVGSPRLAGYAEAQLRGDPVADAAIAEEMAPCFVEKENARTDVIVLACTHYPLLAERMKALAPWPVAFLDPAPAIARRMVDLIGPAPAGADKASSRAVFTGAPTPAPDLAAALAGFGINTIEPLLATESER